MIKISSQSKLCLVNRTGKLEANQTSRKDGICDVINFKTLKKGNWHSFQLAFDTKGATYGCLDKAGNVTLFYMGKNRYTNLDVMVNSSHLTFLDKDTGYLLVAFSDCSIGVYNILSGKQTATLKWHRFRINKLQVNYSSGQLLSVTSDDCVIWDIYTYSRKKTFFPKNTRYVNGCLTSSGEHLLTYSIDGFVTKYSTETQKIVSSVDTNIKIQSALLEESVEGEFVALAGDSTFCLIAQIKDLVFEAFELPNQIKTVKKMKFIRNGLLTLLGDDSIIYTFGVRNNMEIVLAFQLPNKKGIVDYDLSIEAKHLVVISALGEKYVYDFYQLIANQRDDQKDATMRYGSFKRQTLTRVDLSGMRQTNSLNTLKKKKNTINNQNQNDNDSNTEPNVIVLDKIGGSSRGVSVFLNGKKQSTGATNNNNQQEGSFFDISRLNDFLSRFGSFPEDHRLTTWKYVLDLPCNYEAYDNLARKGLHSSYLQLSEIFPIKSQRLYSRTQRILSALTHYCPVFASIDVLPSMIFPFVQLFGADEALCFEICLSFLIQWGQHFFEFSPNPPVSLLKSFLEILQFHDPDLHAALGANIPRAHLFNLLWGSIQVILTDILPRSEWLCFIDQLVLNKSQPDLLLFFLVAYYRYLRKYLLQATSAEQCRVFFQKDHGIRSQVLWKEALSMKQTTPDDIPSSVIFQDNLPLTQDQYPIFNFFPKFSLDQHREIREQIIQDEIKANEKKNTLLELEQLQEQLLNLEKLQETKKQEGQYHQRERNEIIAYEQEMRLARITQTEQEVRQSRLEQMQKLENESRKAIDLAALARKEELEYIEQKISEKKAIDNKFIASKLEEEALLNLELKTAGRLNEVLDTKTKQESKSALNLHSDLAQRQMDLKYQRQSREIDQQLEEDAIRNSHVIQRQSLQRAIQDEVAEQKHIEGKLMAYEFERELKLAEQERERRLRRLETGESLKSQEFLQVYALQENVIQNGQEQYFRDMAARDSEAARKRLEERQLVLLEEKRQGLNELEEHRRKMREITQFQRRSEGEERIQQIRDQIRGQQIDEEQKLQKDIEDIQREREAERILQQELQFKQQEQAESERFDRQRQQAQQNILDEEETSYRNFQEKTLQNLGYFSQQLPLSASKQSRNTAQFSPNKENSSYNYMNDSLNQHSYQ